MNTGDLDRCVVLKRIGEGDGTGGNFRAGDPAPVMERWANEKPLNGGEEVMAGRRQGVRSVVFTLRNIPTTRRVVADRDDYALDLKRPGLEIEKFRIVEAKVAGQHHEWIELLCESGTAPIG